jgi:hypothetical protein
VVSEKPESEIAVYVVPACAATVTGAMSVAGARVASDVHKSPPRSVQRPGNAAIEDHRELDCGPSRS